MNDWYKRAACKNEDIEIFFGKGTRVQRALRICNACPVKLDCRDAGDKEEAEYGHYVYGIRGGENREDRLKRRGYSTVKFELDRKRAKLAYDNKNMPG